MSVATGKFILQEAKNSSTIKAFDEAIKIMRRLADRFFAKVHLLMRINSQQQATLAKSLIFRKKLRFSDLLSATQKFI